jgi:hypothetical protein
MQPEIRHGDWFEVETRDGTHFVSAYEVSRGDITSIFDCVRNAELIRGAFGARLSAPGYMDSTEWTVFDTEEEAKQYLCEAFDLCELCGEDSPDAEVCETCREAEAEEGVVS